MNCYLHPDRPSARAFNVPCAPGGKIHVCSECNADPNIMEAVWNKYQNDHKKRIEVFKAPGNPRN